MAQRWIGTSVKRVEDPRLLRGEGRFLDDLDDREALHVALVRCPYAHALVRSVNGEAALALPGVLAVESAASLGPANGPFPHPTWHPATANLAEATQVFLQPETIRLLAADRALYCGEAVAAVLASDRYRAEDAASLLEVDYEPLPALADPEAALETDAPLLHPEWGSNLAASFVVAKGDVDAAFRDAACVVRDRFSLPRQVGVPLEPRGVLARPDPETGGVLVWSSTQAPLWLRDALVVSLELMPHQVRVVAPDVGGGFGVKSMVYPEELLVPLLALRYQRAVKWVDTRREHLLSATQSRGQVHEIELALAADGTILGLRDRYLVDGGAGNVEALVVPYNTAAHLQGPYRIPALRLECACVLTNKAPLSPYRGAGRPEAVFAMERILDRAAQALGMDPAELRRRNTLRGDEMPYDAGILYRDGTPMVLDGGDYLGCLERALEAVEYDAARRRQARLREQGRYLGIGIAGYIEGTGVGPREDAQVRLLPDGAIEAVVALPSQGQAHATTLAQLCAEILGVEPAQVRVLQGDTALMQRGGGTIASRTAVVVGNAVADAAGHLRERLLEVAAGLLEASPRDLALENGRVQVVGAPDRALPLAEIAQTLASDQPQPVLEGEGSYTPPTVTFANGVHIAVVEVDPETGAVALRRYVVVHDCGRVINPTIVEGQVVGGVVQGIGGALLEEIRYDEDGQLLTASLLDYALPRADILPSIEVHHLETPSTRNPLGFKGVGEAGTIAVPAAIAGAVEDALAPFGVQVRRCPLTSERVRELVAQAEREGIALG